MPYKTFVAFSSADPIVSDTVTGACEGARTSEHDFSPWNRNDASGQPIDKSVHGWVGTANALLADISEPNHNVVYEIARGPGRGNPVRLLRTANKTASSSKRLGCSTTSAMTTTVAARTWSK